MFITANKDKPEEEYSEDGIDLSSLKVLICKSRNYSILNGIEIYSNVVYLDLSSNKLQSVDSINTLPHLSFLNLEKNKISSLAGICDFPALECLNLANNRLTWRELERIRYMHVVGLYLFGNSDLVKDQHYRQHVLDSLPNVWSLDGNYATSSERIRVHRFFQKSAFSAKPVRHKCKDSTFIPTTLQNKRLKGIFGERTTKFLLMFPDKAILNAEWDKRKLNYLCHSTQYQLAFMAESHNLEDSITNTCSTFLNELLTTRSLSAEHNDRFHIILMLFLGSLMFKIPQSLFELCLTAFSLTNYGCIEVNKLFELPTDMKLPVLSTLMSACKIDYDGQNSPLYKELAIALSASVNHIFVTGNVKTSKLNTEYAEYQCLVAAELTLQFCALPDFFEMLLDENVLEFLAVATRNENFPIELLEYARKKEIELKGNMVDLYELLDNVVAEAVNKNINTLITQGHIPRSNSFLEPRALMNPEPRPLYSAPYLAKGLTPPDRSLSCVMSMKPPKRRVPNLGEEVLIGPQNIARILSLPEPKVALIQMPHVPLTNGGMCSVATNASDHYAYINVDTLEWDLNNHRWRPKDSKGDRISIRIVKQSSNAANEDPSLMKSQPVTPTSTKRVATSRSGRSVSCLDFQTKLDVDAKKPNESPPKLYHPLSARCKPKSNIFSNSVEIPISKLVIPSSMQESAGRSSPDLEKDLSTQEAADCPDKQERNSIVVASVSTVKMECDDKTTEKNEAVDQEKIEQEQIEQSEQEQIEQSEQEQIEQSEQEQIEQSEQEQIEQESTDKKPPEQIVFDIPDGNLHDQSNLKKFPPQKLTVNKSVCVKCHEKPRLTVRRINVNFPANQSLIFHTGRGQPMSEKLKFRASPEAQYDFYIRGQQSKNSSRANSVLSRTNDSEKSTVSLSKKNHCRVPPSSAHSRVNYSVATKWLGDGKDIHAKEVLNQHLQQHVAGWKQNILTSHYGPRVIGTPRRALSAAYYSSLACPQCQSSKSFKSANFSSMDLQNSVNHFEELEFYMNTPQIHPSPKISPVTPQNSRKSDPKSSVGVKYQELSL